MRTFTAAAAGLATVLLLTAAPALAQNPPGAEEACTPDAMRLCQQLISEGNHGRIKSCLIRNRRALSPECGRFFSGGGKHRHRRHRS